MQSLDTLLETECTARPLRSMTQTLERLEDIVVDAAE